jgi:hypothetical protein
MKKLLAIAVLALVATSAAAQNYCSPAAVRAAYTEHQKIQENAAPGRNMARYLGAAAGHKGEHPSWADFDRRTWEQTIGLQKALCEAELTQLRFKK